MPGSYAHYRFGCQLLPTLPANIRRPVQRFRRMFDMGLHGPDLFFYHNIFVDDSLKKLGQKLHHMTGREFFTLVCRRLRLESSEAGQAYLYGLLAHYCLDSLCHPRIQEVTADGTIGHIELETEFDRYLLALDGEASPATFDGSRHMRLTKGECVTVAALYPAVTPANVLQSTNTFSAVTKLLATPGTNRRAMMRKAADKVAAKFSPFIMADQPNENCAHLDEDLKKLYDEAAALYPVLLEQLTAHMTYNASLGEQFDKTF